MSDKAREAINADRRLVILRLLVEYRGALNSNTLENGVRAWNHRYVDRDLITGDCRWLEARGLVAVEELRSDVLDVAITPKGERAAKGEEWVDGVARPAKG